jgi:hypothetical protein
MFTLGRRADRNPLGSGLPRLAALGVAPVVVAEQLGGPHVLPTVTLPRRVEILQHFGNHSLRLVLRKAETQQLFDRRGEVELADIHHRLSRRFAYDRTGGAIALEQPFTTEGTNRCVNGLRSELELVTPMLDRRERIAWAILPDHDRLFQLTVQLIGQVVASFTNGDERFGVYGDQSRQRGLSAFRAYGVIVT